MSKKVTRFIEQITPFLIFGILTMFGILALILVSWFLLFGIVIGILFYIFILIRNKFLSKKKHSSYSGRIFEHEDNNNKNS